MASRVVPPAGLVEAAPKAAVAEFLGPDRGPTITARRRVCQPTDSPDGTIRQAAPLDPVLKPVNGADRQKREVMRPKKTILCVDDNEQILSVRTFLLETRGYRVIALTDPHQALEVIANSLPGSLDLLLSDLIMPRTTAQGAQTSSCPKARARQQSCWNASASWWRASAAPRSTRCPPLPWPPAAASPPSLPKSLDSTHCFSTLNLSGGLPVHVPVRR